MSVPDINTANKCLVGVRGDTVVIMKPPFQLSPDEALALAAWLVAVSEHNASHPFAEVLQAVQNT